MGIGKSIQYSIFCENYIECNGMEDFAVRESPQREFKKLGWFKDERYHNVWYCPECVKNNKRSQP